MQHGGASGARGSGQPWRCRACRVAWERRSRPPAPLRLAALHASRAQAAPRRARARQPQRLRPPERTSTRVYTGPACAGALALCAGAAGGGAAHARALHCAAALAALSLRALAAHAGLAAQLAAPRAALARPADALLEALLLLTGAGPAPGADLGAPDCMLHFVVTDMGSSYMVCSWLRAWAERQL